MKKIFLAAVMATLSAGAFAQSFDNVYVSVGGGANVYSDARLSKGAAAGFALDLSVGNWFTPVSGARLQYSGVAAKGFSGIGADKFGFNAIHVDYTWNLSNMIGGEKDRLWSFIPFAGPGVVIGSKGYGARFALAGGLINKVRLTDNLDANLELRAVGIAKPFPGAAVGKIAGRTVTSATIGLSYNF
jgi:hypothetical protein